MWMSNVGSRGCAPKFQRGTKNAQGPGTVNEVECKVINLSDGENFKTVKHLGCGMVTAD